MSQFISESETSDFVRSIFKADSPSVARHENRIQELEELLNLEKEIRKKLERDNIDLQEKVDSVNSLVDAPSVSSTQYNEAVRRRDVDIGRLRKELDHLVLRKEASEQELRNRHHLTVMDLTRELEGLQKQKLKGENDKMILLKELESALVQCDAITKLKGALEPKVENTEGQMVRAKVVVEDLDRQIKETTYQHSVLSEENGSLKSTIDDVTRQFIAQRKVKCRLEEELDECKKAMEEEVRLKEVAYGQSHRLCIENEQMKAHFEEKIDGRSRLQQQLTKANGEATVLRTKYDTDVYERSVEIDDLRKKSAAKINDLTDRIDKEHARVCTLDKNRQRLTLEVTELNSELGRVESERNSLQRSMKSLEIAKKETEKQVEELMQESIILRTTNNKVSLENGRLKARLEEDERKYSSLVKTNDVMLGEATEGRDQLCTVTKELEDIQSTRVQLESERISLLAQLEEKKEVLEHTDKKLKSSQTTLSQLKTDLEQQLAEKSEELSALQKSSQRIISDLWISLTELETRSKAETTRLKKKYEIHHNQLQDDLNMAQNKNVQLKEEVQSISSQLKETDSLLEEEKEDLSLVQEKLASSERRRVQVAGDVEDSRRLLEAADKSRRNIQIEMELISHKSGDYMAQINSLTNDKRKLESEVAAMKIDLNGMTVSKMDNEERAFKLANESNVLMDELRQEQDSHRKGETIKKNLTLELREAKSRLEQQELLATKELSTNTQMNQDQIKNLEVELESERARYKELQSQLKKQDRIVKDLLLVAEDERNSLLVVQQLLEDAQAKVCAYKRRMDELEETNAETVGRYRRTQRQLAEIDVKSVTTDRHYLLSGSMVQGSGAY